MKKIIICLLVILLVGCKHSVYDEYVSKIKKMDEISTNVPFKVEVFIDEVNETRLIYQVIIDEAKEVLNDVKAFVIHDGSKDTYPSIGVLDEGVTLDSNTKGINLVGYVDKKDNLNFKIWIMANNIEYLVIYKM